MPLKKVGNIRASRASGGSSVPSGMRKVGNLRTGVMLPKPKIPVQNTENFAKVTADAERLRKESEQASSFKGMLSNALKAAPQATADVLVGTPVKLATSVAEIPSIVKNRQFTDKTYKVPGLSQFKSFQSDYGNVAEDVIAGKKGLGSAAWELAKVPLAGAEALGLAKGLGKGIKSVKGGDFKGAALDVADAVLPTTRGIKTPEDVAKLPESQGRVLNPVRQFFTSGGRVLRESGEGGKAMEDLIRKQQLQGDLLTGQYNKRISEALGGLSKAERTNVTDVLEGKARPISELADQASKKMRSFYDDIAKEAQSREFTIRTPDGTETPFKPRENYAPRIYNFDELTKANRREEVLQSLVDSGQARNKAEASKLFDDFISANAQRRAGNIENARLYDIPGYEKDAEIAARAYAQKTAGRFTQAENFGKKDEVIASLIDKISNEGGDYQEAQKIFEYLYKGLPKSKVASGLMQYNLITKLDLGALTNLTQVVNTATKAGVLNTLKGVFHGFTKSGRDLAELSNVYDDMVVVNETGMNMSKFTKGVMWLFGKVEQFNRRTAASAGKFRLEDLAKVISENPESGYALRQLKTLGIDAEKLIKGKLTADDIVIAANKMSELTQFKPNVLNVPRYWKTPLGRIATQFKSFSYMQTRFFVDEVLKEAASGNVAPLLRFLTIAPIASYYTFEARNKITGRDPGDSSLNADVRTTDRWLKAMGTLPTSMYGDAMYLRKELSKDMSNPKEFYATPLYKAGKVAGQFGPTAGSVGNLMSSLESDARTANTNNLWYGEHPEAKKDENLNLKRYLAGDVPFVGEYLKNTQFGYGQETVAQQAEKLAKEGLRTGDYEKVKRATEMDPYLNNQTIIRRLMKESDMETWSEEDRKIYEDMQNAKKKPVKPFFM